MTHKKVVRACPICSFRIEELLHNQRFTLPEGHSLPEAYDIVSCNKCGFVYAETPASQEDYSRYYKEFSRYEDKTIATGGGDTPRDAARLEDRATYLSPFIPDKKAAILDVGCANGGLLAALKRKGYSNLTGVDPSHACVQNLRKGLGIKAIVGDVLSFKLPEESFDCVILSHVLEHIVDLKGAMENLLLNLKAGGVLYIEVPDASRYDEYYVVPYYYFDCEHINHFDEYSLKNLASRSGLSYVDGGKKEIEVSDANTYPVVYGMYRKSGVEGMNSDYISNFETRESVVKYLQRSLLACHWPGIEEFVNTQEEVIVWGAGSFTLRLLANTSLDKCNIIAFVDNDSKKHGSKIRGVPVYSPIAIKDYNCPVIVCSALHSGEIVKEMHAMALINRIVVIK